MVDGADTEGPVDPGPAEPDSTDGAWPALRSNGSRFTAETLARSFLHDIDIHHHLWDVYA